MWTYDRITGKRKEKSARAGIFGRARPTFEPGSKE